jgi:trk system potassium uptake protein TrkH
MKEAHGVLTLQNAAQVVRFVGLGTLLIEGIGAVSLTLRFHFHHAMVWKEAMLEGVFYSVSAFCNAGFDLVPGFQGLAFTPYRQDLWLLLLIGLLIVLGGLGFGVLGELGAFTRTRRFSLHAKLVLTISGALILIGMVCFYLLEATNPLTLGAIKSPVEQGVFSWFMSVTPRTAGFSPLDISVLSPPTLLIIELLMVIGASPYSTGGGIKTTTMAVIILAIIAQVRRRQDIEVYGRRISGDMVRLALSLVSVYVLATLLVLFSITIIEITLPGLSSNGEAMTLFERLTFEVISAFGTVGLTHSLTPTLQPVSQVLIMLAMYLGRLGSLAFIFVFAQPTEGPMLRRLPSESVMAG